MRRNTYGTISLLFEITHTPPSSHTPEKARLRLILALKTPISLFAKNENLLCRIMLLNLWGFYVVRSMLPPISAVLMSFAEVDLVLQQAEGGVFLG